MMEIRTYRFASGYQIKTRDANAAGAELARIAAEDGALTPRAVWMRSRRKTALFYAEFLWDDKKAGALYRDEQARYLIRSVRVIIDDRPPVRAFYHITSGESQYVPLDRALSAGEIMAEIVDEAISYLDAAQEKLDEIEILKAEAKAVGKIAASARKKRLRLRLAARKANHSRRPVPSQPQAT